MFFSSKVVKHKSTLPSHYKTWKPSGNPYAWIKLKSQASICTCILKSKQVCDT